MALSRVFVYGTLKPGHERWPALEPFVLDATPAYTYGYMFFPSHGAYPGVLPWVTWNLVAGALVEVPRDAWPEVREILDRIEGHPTLFAREDVELWCGEDNHLTDDPVMAFTYRWNRVPLNVLDKVMDEDETRMDSPSDERVVFNWHPERDTLDIQTMVDTLGGQVA